MRNRAIQLIFGTGVLVLALHLVSGRTQFGDIFNELWPLYLIMGSLIIATGLVFNAPKAIGWPASLAALLGASFLITESQVWRLGIFDIKFTPPTPRSEPLQIATINVWASNTDLEATITYLTTREFDLIAAQEVGLNARDLPDRIKAHYPYQFTCGRGVYVFSRRPFVDAGCPDIPVGLSRRMPLAWVDVQWDGQVMRFVAVHLARPMEMQWRRPQIARLEAFVAANQNRPMILAGDFNAGHTGRSARDLNERLAPMARQDSRNPTWPSERLVGVPLLALDHIWLSPDLCLLSDGVGPPVGSDHLAVFGIVAACPTARPSEEAQ